MAKHSKAKPDPEPEKFSRNIEPEILMLNPQPPLPRKKSGNMKGNDKEDNPEDSVTTYAERAEAKKSC